MNNYSIWIIRANPVHFVCTITHRRYGSIFHELDVALGYGLVEQQHWRIQIQLFQFQRWQLQEGEVPLVTTGQILVQDRPGEVRILAECTEHFEIFNDGFFLKIFLERDQKTLWFRVHEIETDAQFQNKYYLGQFWGAAVFGLKISDFTKRICGQCWEVWRFMEKKKKTWRYPLQNHDILT